MKKSTFRKLCDELSQVKVARFLNVSKPCISKYYKLGYASSNWDFQLQQLSNHKYKQEDFVNDRLTNKPNSKPLVNRNQVNDCLNGSSKSLQSVGKHRQIQNSEVSK